MMQQNIATTSTIVSEYIEAMRKELINKDFGKVGIIFTVHEGKVVGVQEVRETKWIKNGEDST